ncbi:unnamed protein product [Pedinophyceae sp. YPF-701]|nr:unnamed protein product [Pedinophyceae sp. YPF-701]
MSRTGMERDDGDESPSHAVGPPPQLQPSLASSVATLARNLAGTIVRGVSSASEVARDRRLRQRAVNQVAGSASNAASQIRMGAESRVTNVRAVLRRIQERIEENRHAALLAAVQDEPVDVQIGPQLYEDAPQEMRTRLWLSLVDDPIYRQLIRDERGASDGDSAGGGDARGEGEAEGGEVASKELQRSPTRAPAELHADLEHALQVADKFRSGEDAPPDSGKEGGDIDWDEFVSAEQKAPGGVPPRDLLTGQDADAPSRASSDERNTFGDLGRQLGLDLLLGVGTGSPRRHHHHGHVRRRSVGAPKEPDGARGVQPGHRQASVPAQPLAGDDWELLDITSGSKQLAAPNLRSTLQAAGEGGAGEGAGGPSKAPPGGLHPTAALMDPNDPRLGADRGDPGVWGSCRDEEELVRRLWESMTQVQMPVTDDYVVGAAGAGRESRYATLLQISIGLEDVDEEIRRDIHRTFPEHPRFSRRDGQEALYNVLKAYSVHDLEVGYCQGMAFVAGCLLMYVPQEAAFHLLRMIMAPRGGNMRALFLPGLGELRATLARLEWLVRKHLPRLAAHLEKLGVPAVLYASQWFLTAFSCPMPPPFACRVLDVVLIERSTAIMLRVALSMLESLEEELLGVDDFEETIAGLKLGPVGWPAGRMRAVLNNAVAIPLADEDVRDIDGWIGAAEAEAEAERDAPRSEAGGGQRAPGVDEGGEGGSGDDAGGGEGASGGNLIDL